MTHIHHLIPKYMGGNDAKENLVEVTVTQHAMFHYCNWRLWGNKEDWLAWRGLTGEIGKEEIVREARRLAGVKGIAAMQERLKFLRENDSEFVAKARAHAIKIQPKAILAAKGPESNQKRKESFKRIGHSQGSKNSQYGTMWITNGTVNKKIKKTDQIPEGYYPGRKLK